MLTLWHTVVALSILLGSTISVLLLADQLWPRLAQWRRTRHARQQQQDLTEHQREADVAAFFKVRDTYEQHLVIRPAAPRFMREHQNMSLVTKRGER